MGSERTVKTVQKWLSACDAGHLFGSATCVAARRTMNSPAVPTRLINLHGHDSETWSLVEKRHHVMFPRYVALSHSWTADTPRLLEDNRLAFQACQPDNSVPRSYHDVFVLCRRLGIQYVWIDSLCILQDSADDFLREAATMTEVYANAFCTFSICWESPDGFLRPRDTRALPRWDVYDQDLIALSDRYVFVQDQRELRAAIGQAPVNQRGWVLQEQLLSPRVLYLGNDQLYWECDDTILCETEPDMFSSCVGDYRRKNIVVRGKSRRSTFRDLVVHFMRLGLTFERDRLVAISGIARFLFHLTKDCLPGEGNLAQSQCDQLVEYVAGIQMANWIEDLLWNPIPKSTPPKLTVSRLRLNPELFDRCPDDTIPSWSWAACPGPVEWKCWLSNIRNEEPPQFGQGPLAYLRQSNFVPLGEDIYGLPKSASLDISCLIVEGRYMRPGSYPKDIYAGIERTVDQAHMKCFGLSTVGFILPRPHMGAHDDGHWTITVPFDPCDSFKPNCFVMPLHIELSGNWPAIRGLVIQERRQTENSMNTREFVRIGSFDGYGDFTRSVIDSVSKNIPFEGDEFESRLRDFAQRWKEEDKTYMREGAAVKAEWVTIRLV